MSYGAHVQGHALKPFSKQGRHKERKQDWSGGYEEAADLVCCGLRCWMNNWRWLVGLGLLETGLEGCVAAQFWFA